MRGLDEPQTILRHMTQTQAEEVNTLTAIAGVRYVDNAASMYRTDLAMLLVDPASVFSHPEESVVISSDHLHNLQQGSIDDDFRVPCIVECTCMTSPG